MWHSSSKKSAPLEYLFNEAATRRRSNYFYNGDESGLVTVKTRGTERFSFHRSWVESEVKWDQAVGFGVSDLAEKLWPKWLPVSIDVGVTQSAVVNQFRVEYRPLTLQFDGREVVRATEANFFVRTEEFVRRSEPFKRDGFRLRINIADVLKSEGD